MNRIDNALYFGSVLLQLAAVVIAARMVRETDHRRPWMILLVALLVMFCIRAVGVFLPDSVTPHVRAIASIAISMFFLTFLFFIRQIAAAERRSKAIAQRRSLELDQSEARYRQLAEERRQLFESERAARNEAERASRLKDEFLATLSHELRTPLNAILGWAQLLRQNHLGEEERTMGAETIERNARVQTRIIEDLLDMSRILSGKVRLEVQRVELAAVLEMACESVLPAASAKGISLIKELSPQAGPVIGDPARLQQICWNLLSNAMKFTPRGGRVRVTLAGDRSQVEITVSDDGEGITPEFLPHIFERFRQQDATTTRRHGGLGLGLAITRQLVELHGGSIHATSNGIEQGACFTVSLPVLAGAEDQAWLGQPSWAVELGEEAQMVRLDGLTVLVVDDEPDARDLIQRILLRSKATVLLAESALRGAEILQRQRPDVLLSDVGMPDKDGYEFIRDVRALPPEKGGKIPAVALTAFARSEDRTRAMMAGYQVHISKPVEPRELIATIASLAGRAAGGKN